MYMHLCWSTVILIIIACNSCFLAFNSHTVHKQFENYCWKKCNGDIHQQNKRTSLLILSCWFLGLKAFFHFLWLWELRYLLVVRSCKNGSWNACCFQQKLIENSDQPAKLWIFKHIHHGSYKPIKWLRNYSYPCCHHRVIGERTTLMERTILNWPIPHLDQTRYKKKTSVILVQYTPSR